MDSAKLQIRPSGVGRLGILKFKVHQQLKAEAVPCRMTSYKPPRTLEWNKRLQFSQHCHCSSHPALHHQRSWAQVARPCSYEWIDTLAQRFDSSLICHWSYMDRDHTGGHCVRTAGFRTVGLLVDRLTVDCRSKMESDKQLPLNFIPMAAVSQSGYRGPCEHILMRSTAWMCKHTPQTVTLNVRMWEKSSRDGHRGTRSPQGEHSVPSSLGVFSRL
ncbi:hypothetical protein UPYG_G00242480 [Umbra pygmaea]|uniref:Uncharacterized protein n=1 Tax=Umbra pygmaea TaxID=75934 RepID=A0ABD0WKM8_UMBPY